MRDEAIFVSPCKLGLGSKYRKLENPSSLSNSFSLGSESLGLPLVSDFKSVTVSEDVEGQVSVSKGEGLEINPPWDILRGRCVFKIGPNWKKK